MPHVFLEELCMPVCLPRGRQNTININANVRLQIDLLNSAYFQWCAEMKSLQTTGSFYFFFFVTEVFAPFYFLIAQYEQLHQLDQRWCNLREKGHCRSVTGSDNPESSCLAFSALTTNMVAESKTARRGRESSTLFYMISYTASFRRVLHVCWTSSRQMFFCFFYMIGQNCRVMKRKSRNRHTTVLHKYENV